jgi:hypothetical protein
MLQESWKIYIHIENSEKTASTEAFRQLGAGSFPDWNIPPLVLQKVHKIYYSSVNYK